MNTPQYWNVNQPRQTEQPQPVSSGYQPVGLARTSDLQATASSFANTRQPEAIIVFDLLGLVTSLVAKTPFFQTRLSSITPGTHYMLVLLQMGYNAQQMDQLTSSGEYVGTAAYPGARILQQHGGAAGGVMMLFAPLQEFTNDQAMGVVKNDNLTSQAKQAYISPTTYQPQTSATYNQPNAQVAVQQVASSQPVQQQYAPQQTQYQPSQPQYQQEPPQQTVPKPEVTAPTVIDTQAIIEAAVKAALAEQAARLAAQHQQFSAPVQPVYAPPTYVQTPPQGVAYQAERQATYQPQAEPQASPSAPQVEPVIQVAPVEPMPVVSQPVSEVAEPVAYAQAPIPVTENEPVVEVIEQPQVAKAAGPAPLYALADDMPNSFVVHPVGSHAKGHFIWQHRNNDLHIIAYGIVIPTSPSHDINQVVDLVQNSLHSVVVQLGNAEADDIMIGLNEVYQSKVTTVSEESKSAYVEVSVCILNYKQKIVDLSGAPYGSFFLRAGNVSGIQNGRIAALASQMKINKQDLRCARFRMDELNAVYLFSIGSIIKGHDATKASKVHNQVMNMLESVMKMPYKEQQEAMRSHLSMLLGENQGLPILIGIKTS